MGKTNGLPPYIVKALGVFDLDPCSPVNRPWDTALRHLTIHDDGLAAPWASGDRVWCNPPYGTQCALWMKKMAKHGNGIALTFARTETKMFFESVWPVADAVLFLSGRVKFIHLNRATELSSENVNELFALEDRGKQGDNAGAPSVLIAYGKENAHKLSEVMHLGKFIKLK